jgi:HAD superfamily hydrolase (TIGR01484 family)
MNAYIFDVDGVISHPNEKKPTIEGILDIIVSNLSKQEPVALNTGRSLEWITERVIGKLLSKITDKTTLQYFFAVGEKGGTWLTFDQAGKIIENRDNSISVPIKLQKKIKNLVEKEFSDTTFFDNSKQTMISTEMLDSIKNEREKLYRPAQERIVERMKDILKEMRLEKNFKIDPTTIATDIENNHVGKHYAVNKILSWLRSSKTSPDQFLAFGDSKSDIPMAEELHAQGYPVKFIFVGNKAHIKNPKEYLFPIIITSAEYEYGTLEYLTKLT